MVKKASKNKIKILVIFLILIFFVGGLMVWNYVFKSNTTLEGKSFTYLKIPKNTDYNELKKIIESSGAIKDMDAFDLFARRTHLDENIHPGRYRVNAGMSNRQIVKMLKNGIEEKVEVNINYLTRTKSDLIGKLVGKLNIDEQALFNFLENDFDLENRFGLDKNTIMVLVRPGKYYFSWATDHLDFFDFMKKEFDKFWNSDRQNQLKSIKLSKQEVMIMASIIEWESKIPSEQRKIAGVYVNRILKNMPLQADPTVIFALNNFKIQRVSFEDLKFDSPYNTYKYKGLPPGPIGFPSEKAINSVLNYEKNDYLFFCAKPELNGYSNFSSSYAEHEAYAKAYRNSLNKRGIRR